MPPSSSSSGPLLLSHELEHAKVQGYTLAHPCSSLCMVSLLLPLIPRIGMDQGAQRATVYDKPRDKSPKLRWSEKVDFEHRNCMRSNGPAEEGIDAKFGNYTGVCVREYCAVKFNKSKEVGMID